jgi:hypothetical protein
MDVWVGYERQRNQLVKFLERARADQVGNSNFVMLFGGYGTGKSHALLWAQNLILNREKTAFNSVCYFIPTLKKDKGKLTFAGAFIDDLVSKSSLLADLKAFRNFIGSSVTRYRDDNSVPHDQRDETLIEKLFPAVDLYNFAKDIYRCESDDQFRALLAPRGLTDYQAIVIFTRLVNLFVYEIKHEAGSRRFKKAAYLFIDELDDLLRSSVKETREINDALRHLYDGCPHCFCLGIALSAEVAEFTAIFEDFVLSRIQRQIQLPLLDKDDAVGFVTAILDRSRPGTGGPGGAFPFEDSAIEAIASQLVEITPRKIVNTMQQVIEEVRLAGYDPGVGPISLAVLDEHDILDEVLGDGGVA